MQIRLNTREKENDVNPKKSSSRNIA